MEFIISHNKYSRVFSVSIAEDEENLDQYIEEDRETEICQSHSTAKRVQQAVLKMLRDELRIDEILDETIQQELILQVISNVFLSFSVLN